MIMALNIGIHANSACLSSPLIAARLMLGKDLR